MRPVRDTLSPSRSAQVPEAPFGADTVGILLSDRYVVYKQLARQWQGLDLAFCWPHVRRDFFCHWSKSTWPESGQLGDALRPGLSAIKAHSCPI